MNRSRALWMTLAVGAVLMSWGCNGSRPFCDTHDCDQGPKLGLGGETGPGRVTATYPKPCEIDLDFGNVAIGGVESATVEVNNIGEIPVDLSQGTPDSDPEFSLSAPSPEQSVEPSAAVEFIATFQPDKVGQASSTFTIQSDGWNSECPAGADGSAEGRLTVHLTGNGVDLSLEVQPVAIDFGKILINTTATKSVVVINKSTAAVSGITSMVIGGDADLFVVESAPATLGPGDSATVEISYSPIAIETRSLASVQFAGSDGQATSLNLFGEPVGVALTLAPNPCDFGYVPLMTTAVCCTTVSNQANLPVAINGLSEFANEGGSFAVATTDDATPPNPYTFPSIIEGGESAKACFQFRPPITQQYSGSVVLDSTDPSGTNPTLALTGWGGGPQIQCLPASIDFGQALIHGITTVPVLCQNVGSAIPVTNLIIEPPIAGPLAFAAQLDQTKDIYPLNGLAPGQIAQIDVSYSPTGTAGDKGTLFIRSNGGKGKTVEIPLTGQGLDVAPCQLVVSPSQLDFGNVEPGGTSQALSFEVQNVGADACYVQGLGLDYDPSGAFQVLSTSIQPDPTTGEIVIPPPAAGGTSGLIVSLAFAPAVQGKSFVGEVGFTISDSAEPNRVVPLTGSGESTCLVVAPPALDLGEADVTGMQCSNASQAFTIMNACSAPATIKSVTVQSDPADPAQQFTVSVGQTLPLTLAPGDATVVGGVFFEPSALGSHAAEVLISDGKVETALPVTGQAVSSATASETFVVRPAEADVLFIMDVDDDATDQARIAGAMPAFLAAAGQIDYRLAITTDNDLSTDPTAELGRLLPCQGCSLEGSVPTIVSPSSTPDGGGAPDPAAVFSDLWLSVPNDLVGPGAESDHSFVALYDALRRGPEVGVDFFRPGAFFAVIADGLGDQDDGSRYGAGGHDPAWYEGFFEAYFRRPFLFSWNFLGAFPGQAVTGTGFANAVDLPPGIGFMVAGTNGVAIDSSDPQWPSAFASVWSSALAAHASYLLTGKPSQGQTGMVVTVNGTVVNQLAAPGVPNWTYQAGVDAVAFNQGVYSPLIGEAITVTYPIGCE